MKKCILKYLSFLLVITVLLQMPIKAAEKLYTEKEKQQYQDSLQFLIKLGIFDEQKDITTTVTRAEYARVLVALSIGDALTDSNEYKIFTDVDKKTKYADYIYAGANLGLLMGYGDGTFRPDNMVKTEEAITGIVKVLGYETYAEKKGGYSKGYISVAQDIALLDGTSVYIGYDITYGLLIKLVMNSLDVELLNPVYVTNDKIQYERGENRLAKRIGVEKRTGILEATEKSSLYSESGIAKNSVTINGNNYIVDKDYNDILGYCVEYYVDIDDEKIIHINKKFGKNDDLTVYSKDIENYQDREYKYNYNSKLKKIRLANSVAIIYNGVCETEPTNEMMWPKNGWITLIDNNNDGYYDVLSITEYETYVIYFVDTVNKKVYDMFDSLKVLSFDDNDFSIEDAAGTPKGLENLKKWNVLSVKQSVNKVVTEIIVCEDSVRGTVERISDDEIVISANSYEFSEDFIKRNIEIGKRGTFFIDVFGRIVAMSDSLGNGMEICYLINARIVDDDEEMVKLKMCDSSGRIVVSYTAQKVKMDNLSRVSPQVIISNFQKGTSEILPQPIMVGYDNDGKINKIDTAYNNKPSDSGNIFSVIPENGENRDSFRVVYPSGTMNYYSAQKTFDGKINLTDATIIYGVPETMTDVSDDDFKVVGIGSLRGDHQYNCEFYSLGVNNSYADICVVKGKDSVDARKKYGVVTKIKQTIDQDNEPVNEIQFTDYSGSMVGMAYNAESTGIEKGDFVEFTINRENEIISMARVYDESREIFELTNPTSAAFNEPDRLLLGYVYSKEKSIISIAKEPITGNVNRTDLENHAVDKYKCYMYEDGSLREIMPEEVLDYKHTGSSNSKIVIYTYYGEPRMLVVYK